MNQYYKISIPHFYSLTYEEGDHSLSIEVDFRDEQPILDCNLVKQWNSPYESEVIDDIKKDEICSKIQNYLTHKRGFDIIVRK